MKKILLGMAGLIVMAAGGFAFAESNGINEYVHSIKGTLKGKAFGQAVAACARHHGRTRNTLCGRVPDVPPTDPPLPDDPPLPPEPPTDPAPPPEAPPDEPLPPPEPDPAPEPPPPPPVPGECTSDSNCYGGDYQPSVVFLFSQEAVEPSVHFSREEIRQSAAQAKTYAALARQNVREASAQAKALAQAARQQAREASAQAKAAAQLARENAREAADNGNGKGRGRR